MGAAPQTLIFKATTKPPHKALYMYCKYTCAQPCLCAALLMIVFTILVLMGTFGLLIGVLLALFLTGNGALMGLAVVFAGASQMILLFLAATLIDTTTAVFAFYAIDKANATVSGEHGAELHAVVGKYGENTGQIETAAPVNGGANAQGGKITPGAMVVNNPAANGQVTPSA